MRAVGAYLWRFQLLRVFIIYAVQWSPGPLSTFLAFRASPLMMCLRDVALKDGDFEQAAKITAALQREGEL